MADDGSQLESVLKKSKVKSIYVRGDFGHRDNVVTRVVDFTLKTFFKITVVVT